MKSEAYDLGVKDYWNYLSISDNPYNAEVERLEWEEGFTDARALDNSDIEEMPK